MITTIVSNVPEEAYTTDTSKVAEIIKNANNQGIARREVLENASVIYMPKTENRYYEMTGKIGETKTSYTIEDENGNITTISKRSVIAIKKV